MNRHVIAALALIALFAAFPISDRPAHAASNLSGCVAGQMVQQSASGGPLVCVKGATLTVSARLVDISLLGDVGQLAIPAGVTKYQLLGIQITNCTVVPVLAQPNINTLPNSGGTSIVAAAVITGATSGGVILNSTLLSIAQTNALIAPALYVNMTVANAVSGTCDFYATIKDLT